MNNQSQSSINTNERLFVLIFILTVIIVYSPALTSGFIWDDDNYVTNNKTLRSYSGLKDIWFKPGAIPQYYPLVHTTFWLEYQLWELRPFGYHIINLVFHIINALLLWRILVYLKIPWGWIAAVIFVIHPVHVESVAWVTERKNVLSGLFYLCSLLAYLKFYDRYQDNKYPLKEKVVSYFSSFILFICALLSKTVTCSLPVTLIIILWWKKRVDGVKSLMLLCPYFIIGFILGTKTVFLEKYDVGAFGREWDYSFLERCLIAGRALWFYLAKILWPDPLIFIYERWEIRGQNIVQYFFPVSFIIVLITFFVMRHKKYCRSICVSLVLFLATLFPALGFFNVYPMRYSFVADHFQYLGSVPIIVMFAFLLFKHLTLNDSQLGMSPWLCGSKKYFLFTIIFAVLGTLTWFHCYAFKNSESLWIDTLAKNPKAWIAHNNLGLINVNRGLVDLAIFHYKEAIRLKPNHARAYNNLAMAYSRKNEKDRAILAFESAIEIATNDVRILNNYANFLTKIGELEIAYNLYHQCLEINPYSVFTNTNLGIFYSKKNDFKNAVIRFNIVLKYNPLNAKAHYNLGLAYLGMNDKEKAFDHFYEAVNSNPSFSMAHYKLGESYWKNGDANKAISHLRYALHYNDSIYMAHFILGNIFQQRGQHQNAIYHTKQAIRLKPNFAEAYNNLGGLYLLIGDIGKAINNYKFALELKPNYPDARKNLNDVMNNSGNLKQ